MESEISVEASRMTYNIRELALFNIYFPSFETPVTMPAHLFRDVDVWCHEFTELTLMQILKAVEPSVTFEKVFPVSIFGSKRKIGICHLLAALTFKSQAVVWYSPDQYWNENARLHGAK